MRPGCATACARAPGYRRRSERLYRDGDVASLTGTKLIARSASLEALPAVELQHFEAEDRRVLAWLSLREVPELADHAGLARHQRRFGAHEAAAWLDANGSGDQQPKQRRNNRSVDKGQSAKLIVNRIPFCCPQKRQPKFGKRQL